MKKFSFLAITAVSSLLFAGSALAEESAKPNISAKSVTFKIINHSTHAIDLDTDGGVNGECKENKDLITCTAESDGKISVGGHLAVDRSFKKPAGIFGALLSVSNPPNDEGQNFVIQNIESSPVRAALSKDKWSGNNDEVSITVTDSKK